MRKERGISDLITHLTNSVSSERFSLPSKMLVELQTQNNIILPSFDGSEAETLANICEKLISDLSTFMQLGNEFSEKPLEIYKYFLNRIVDWEVSESSEERTKIKSEIVSVYRVFNPLFTEISGDTWMKDIGLE